MALVTRTLTNTGQPMEAPDGTLAENKTIHIQLVDFAKRQPIALFDATSGEYITGEVVTAVTDGFGIFSVDLWPNSRGETATCYKVSLPGTTLKPFYIQISEAEDAISLLNARAAMEAVTPQVLSLFDTLLASIIGQVGTMTARVTQETDGLMSYQDKIKLDDINSGEMEFAAADGSGRKFTLKVVSGGFDDGGNEILYPVFRPVII